MISTEKMLKVLDFNKMRLSKKSLTTGGCIISYNSPNGIRRRQTPNLKAH